MRHNYINQQFGNYRLNCLIGEGGFAQVYLGKHIHLGTPAAIKILTTELTEVEIAQFRDEARIVIDLGHPHIVRVLDFGMQGPIPFIVMAYAPLGSLRTVHPKGSHLQLPLIVTYVKQIASALQYIHDRKLIHRDVKPENMLANQDGGVALSDFGIVVVAHSERSLSQQALEGTAIYMAPEQFQGKPQPASDQYALGIVAYEWITGTPPFRGNIVQLAYQHSSVFPQPLHEQIVVPPHVEEVIQKALAKDPKSRFTSVQAFALALEQACQSTPFNNIPAPFTSLVGRDKERDIICALLVRPDIHLLTLTGIGGVGKTRLALSVAQSLREVFTDGICFVSLAKIQDPDLVISAIAEVLELQTRNRPIWEMVQIFLRNKHFLLVLDNFEHVIKAASHLTSLLSTCPDLTILITSREKLHMQCEYEFTVPPLQLPKLVREQDLAVLVHNDAIALFVERAKTIQSDFCLTEANTRTVAEICILLEGLPLALELAAARIKLLSPTALLFRLSSRLQVLTGGWRDAPARHQTLRNTIKWSYDLLSVNEQRLFRRLCIFVGGCSLEAIEEFYGRLAHASEGVLENLAQLMDKNLIKLERTTHEGRRIVLLETIREFGLECLQECGEYIQIQRTHAQYYLAWIEIGSKELFGPNQLIWITALLQDIGNLRAVMRFVLQSSEQDMALRLGAALGPFWLLLGVSNQPAYMIEGTQFMQQVLENDTKSVKEVYARTLIFYGGQLAWLGEAERGERCCWEGLKLFQQLEDQEGVIHALWMLFLALYGQCKLREAHQVAQEAVRLSRQYGEICTRWGTAWTKGVSHFWVGMVAVYDGCYAEGRMALEESMKLCRQAGEHIFPVWSNLFLGEITALEGKDEEAQALLEESRNASRELETKAQESEALRFLGLLALRADNINQAEVLLAESMRLARDANDVQDIIWALVYTSRKERAQQRLVEARLLLEDGLALAMNLSDKLTLPAVLEGLASVVAKEGKPVKAARLFAAGQKLREITGEPLPPIDRLEYEWQVAAVRATLGEAYFSEAWMQGQRMALQQILSAQESPVIRLSGL